MRRREFLGVLSAIGATAVTGGTERAGPLDLGAMNTRIKEHRNVYRGQNIYTGTVGKLYDDVAYWPEPMLADRTFTEELIELQQGSPIEQSKAKDFLQDELYHKGAFETAGLNEQVQFVHQGMDFPEERLFNEREAEIHLLPLYENGPIHGYMKELADDVEAIANDELQSIDVAVRAQEIGQVDDPASATLRSQEQYLEENPSVVQVYYSEAVEGRAASSTPNSNQARITLPSDDPEDWGDTWDSFLRHVTVHEAVGHSLLDIGFHPYTRDGVMSYHDDAGHDTSFSELSRLWIDRYLDAEFRMEETTTDVDGKEFDAVRGWYEPGEVDSKRDHAVTQDHLKTVLADRYDLDDELISFTGLDQHTRTDEAFGDSEVIDCHRFDYEGRSYRMYVDHYIRGIAKE